MTVAAPQKSGPDLTDTQLDRIQKQLKKCQSRVDAALAAFLAGSQALSKPLQEAISYGVFNGGKRLRPALVYATGEVCLRHLGATEAQIAQVRPALDGAACAVELMHSYSLIHDDLPAMDDAALRRGAPSCHAKHGEALAILAGDGLQVLALQALMQGAKSCVPESRLLTMVEVLLKASGPAGMVGGQAKELSVTTPEAATENTLTAIYQGKTGALLEASVMLGALAVGCESATQVAALEQFAKAMGLAFQIHDDCLDVLASTQTLGKPAGIDAQNNKMTFPYVMGLAQSQALRDMYFEHAVAALDNGFEKAGCLTGLAQFMVRRGN